MPFAREKLAKYARSPGEALQDGVRPCTEGPLGQTRRWVTPAVLVEAANPGRRGLYSTAQSRSSSRARAYGFSAMHPSATRRASAWPGRASGSRPGISLWWSLGRSAADYFGNLIAVAAPKPGHVRLVPEGPLAGRRLIPQVDQHEPRRIIHASGVAHTATEHSIPSCQQMTHGGAGTRPTRHRGCRWGCPVSTG